MSEDNLIAEARQYADMLDFLGASSDGAPRYLRALADALEAAQRPALGYIAIDTKSEVVLTKGYWGSTADVAILRRGVPLAATIAELREVQP